MCIRNRPDTFSSPAFTRENPTDIGRREKPHSEERRIAWRNFPGQSWTYESVFPMGLYYHGWVMGEPRGGGAKEGIVAGDRRPAQLMLTMQNLPPESRASGRELFGGVIVFVAGFIVMLAALLWLYAYLVSPEASGWEILNLLPNAIIIAFLFGGLSAVLFIGALSWYHHRRGYYRCPYCNRPRKQAGVLCMCQGTIAKN